MANKTLLNYIEEVIDKNQVKEEKDLLSLNWNFIMSKAFMLYLKDNKKVKEDVKETKDKFNNKIRRVELQW